MEKKIIIILIIIMLYFMPNRVLATQNGTDEKDEIISSQEKALGIGDFISEADKYTGNIDISQIFEETVSGKLDNTKIIKYIIAILGDNMKGAITMIAGIIIIIWYYFQTKQYQEIKNEHLAFDDKVFREFKKQRESRRKKYAVMIIVGVVILLASSEIGHFLMIYFGQTACNVFEWIADTVWLALIIWAGMSMHIDSIIIKNTEHTPKSSHMKRYRWVYMAFPVTVVAVLIGMITNVWSPYAPIIILFCCLLVTTCKLLIESRGKDE